MQRVADYKIIKDTVNYIGSNQSHSVDFTLSGAVAKTNGAQRPYLLMTEELSGAFPGTISISLNGTEIDSRSGDANNLLSGSHSYTHMVAFDGNLLNLGSTNTLTVDVSTSANTQMDLGRVILHFQREV